jgi:hypothetical protein
VPPTKPKKSKKPALIGTIVSIIGLAGAGWWLPSGSAAVAYGVDIVDVVPPDWSTDALPQPEPNVAVNPTNPQVMAVSAILLGWGEEDDGFCPPDKGGIVISLDGGNSWSLRCVLPLVANTLGARVAGDVSLDFAGNGTSLLATYLSPVFGGASVSTLRAVEITGWDDAQTTIATNITPADGIANTDLPHSAASPAAGSNTLTVGVNKIKDDNCASGTGATGTMYWWINGTEGSECVERRASRGPTQAVRPAVHESGRAYGVFFNSVTDTMRRLVIVGGNVANANATTATFNQLVETGSETDPCKDGDGNVGIRLTKCIEVLDEEVIFSDPPTPPAMGGQIRKPNQLAVAVAPTDKARVYIAYGSKTGSDLMTLKLVRYISGAKAIDKVLRTVHNGINPAVAVDAHGRVGFLYQRWVVRGADSLWETNLTISNPNQTSWEAHLLSRTPAAEPQYWYGLPYIGDYIDLVAVGDTFYGVFSANNDPVHHPTARYLRPLDTGSPNPTLPPGVPVSMDPFFFRAYRTP